MIRKRVYFGERGALRRGRSIAWLLVAFGFAGCSLDANITGNAPPPAISDVSLNRTSSDFLSGEVVTTPNGTKIRAVFGEIAEKKVLSSGHKIEGVIR